MTLDRIILCKFLGIHKWYKKQSEYQSSHILPLTIFGGGGLTVLALLSFIMLLKGLWTSYAVWFGLICPILLIRLIVIPQCQKTFKVFDGICIHCHKVCHDATRLQKIQRDRRLREELLTNQARDEYNEMVKWGQNED